MTLDELLQTTENLKSEINVLEWHENDVRHSFFGLSYSNIYHYYIGKTCFELAQLMGNGDIMFRKTIIEFTPHAQRLYEIQAHPYLSNGYHFNLNRNILLGSWTSFELSINLIFDYLVNEHEFESIVKEINIKIIKAISSLEDRYKATIIEILKKSSFVPLLRKFDFIVKKNKSAYASDLKIDKNFIDFMGKLRNCIVHSNGHYHGSEFSHEFNRVTFIFKNKEIFSQKGENNDVFLEMALQLQHIFRSLCPCISAVGYIPYPDDGQNQLL